jgi:uncharacterized membrane protein
MGTAAGENPMQALKKFLKTTIVGGLLFLVPVILLIVILGHAMRIVGKFAGPIAAAFPANEIAGVAIATVVAALILLLAAFVAGLVARTGTGRSVMRWFEESLLGGLPQYRMMKTMAEGLAQVEDASGIKPALVSIEGGWQIGYVLEEMQTGWTAVFLPQAPTPMSGNVMYMPSERVRPLDMPIGEAMLLVKRLGVGSARALAQADLTPVPEG